MERLLTSNLPKLKVHTEIPSELGAFETACFKYFFYC